MGIEAPTPEQLETAETQPLINPYTDRLGEAPLTTESAPQTPIENSSGVVNERVEPVSEFILEQPEAKEEDEAEDEQQPELPFADESTDDDPHFKL